MCRDCPVFVRSYVAHKVWEDMRQPALHSDGAGSDGNSGTGDSDDSDEDDDDDREGDMIDAPVNSSE